MAPGSSTPQATTTTTAPQSCPDRTQATTTTTTTEGPTTTLPADQMLYQNTADYHWDRFDKNSSKQNVLGGWKKGGGGLAQGPFGFGKAVSLKDEQCMYDTNWMRAEEGLETDPCMMNPMNCTEGLSISAWEQMAFSSETLVVKSTKTKRYLVSNGGDHNAVTGMAWPGFAIYHQGVDIVGMVSTGDRVWVISVSGQIYNNTWTQVGFRFILPNLNNPKMAETPEGREKMGGLELYINKEKVGHSILPELTAAGSTMWKAQPRLSADGTETGPSVMMFGCHQNSDMQQEGTFNGYAGTDESPAAIDEVAVWKKQLANNELDYFYGGYSAEFADINADQFSAMLGGVDLADPEQAAAAQAVLQAMLQGPPTTLPPFPTRTPEPTTTTTTTLSPEDASLAAAAALLSTTTLKPAKSRDSHRKNVISQQNLMSTMLRTEGVLDGQDPEEVEGRFSMASVASALLTTDEENVAQWEALSDISAAEGATKTVRELEEYMLTWVGSVNISADRADDHNWKTNYFDSTSDRMRYVTTAKDMVLNVDKIPLQPLRDGGEIRVSYPDYDSWEWREAKSMWNNVKDNFTVPTGMFENIAGCNDKPITILTAVYNGLTYVAPKRRNPVNIRSRNFKIDTKVISVRVKLNADSMIGDETEVYQCQPDRQYMKDNPVRITFYHNEPAKAKRTLLWHTDDYWEGLEVRHCVHWNEHFGYTGAWDDTNCRLLDTNPDKTECECSEFGSYAVLAELMESPNMDDREMWILAVKWVGIILGTILLTVFIAIVFFSVVVGEMFHQIRMWTCFSYMIGNILMLVSDTGICDGRHTNMAFSMGIMFFFQAALWWNMCETHATFKGVTSGLINGRTSVYHPIAWGMPLICIGLITFLEGRVLGTHPYCFISWEKPAIQIFFAYNILCFFLTTVFTIIVLFNLVKVQSHNRDTVMYLKDQVKGMIGTSLIMMILWCYGAIGFWAYMKTNDMEIINLMPAFQILNGWCGVIMFLLLGMWSKRFRLALSSQASKDQYEVKENESIDETPRTALTTPASSRPASAAGSRPASAAPSKAGSRPASATSKAGSRPGSSASKAGSRPASAALEPAAVEEEIAEEPLDNVEETAEIQD